GDAACADDNPCTEDLCGDDGVCSHAPFCCFEVTAYATGFEEGLVGWYVADLQADDGVTWTTSDTSSSEGVSSAWLGDPLTGTYAAPGPVHATLRTPQITLPEGGDSLGVVAIRFSLALSTEWDGQPYDNPAGIDRLSLEVSPSTGTYQEVWSSDEVDGSTNGQWLDVEVSLTPWAGQHVQLQFTFDTGDEGANDFSGPRIDDVRIGHVCP
ncbi:MAG: hypothetical protein QF464_18880, partial [Myxococcota bacterium]|nr:hypothetical protein [Myxococcota bacterium]